MTETSFTCNIIRRNIRANVATPTNLRKSFEEMAVLFKLNHVTFEKKRSGTFWLSFPVSAKWSCSQCCNAWAVALHPWNTKRDHGRTHQIFQPRMARNTNFSFSSLILWVLSGNKVQTLASLRLFWHDCSSLIFQCFHSSWRGQQQRAWNGIANDSEVLKADKNELFTLWYCIQTFIYNYEQANWFEEMNPQETRI